MGNTNSGNVTSGVKEQAAGETREIYKYIDMKGGGALVDLMKKTNKTKNYKELDEQIKEGLKHFMYNDGNGKMAHVSELVQARCRDKGIDILKRYNRNDPNELVKLEQLAQDVDYIKKNGPQYMETCWRLDKRGAVGENALHCCLLNASSIHADLAKRLLKHYPKLLNDIYISEEYYGENVLHMAIVNEDPAMVKFYLDLGADYHQRCCGNFFCPDDQKASRTDSLEHDWVDVSPKTNYDGYTYWGEYPLGFAACLGQEECIRLLVAKGADPNKQDVNGNTVLHLLVIHDKKEMFDLLVDLGAKLHIQNRQGLTPLTLAAKLARKEMYEHILEIEREVFWIFGNVTCAAYPLQHIDTISSTGEINTNSAMYHVVTGDEPNHLEMIDGMISQLLHRKWKTFAKYRFIRRFIAFFIYFVIFVGTFLLRPGTDTDPIVTTEAGLTNNMSNYTYNRTVRDPCYLLRIRSDWDIARIVLECFTLLGATIYVFLSLKEIYHQGFKIFFQTLIASPSKALFLLANFFVILMVPGRAACHSTYEDVMGVLAILCTAPYFLFFCRGLRIVGPFVVMIYKMIRTDLLRFFTIYLIFVVGFSQAMYVIFRGKETTIFNHPIEAMMGMFIMSLGEFADIYESFRKTDEPNAPKIIFVIYMILVTLLLVNMLIAMMGNTYQMVNETQTEWLRQWAKIILVVEQTVTTEERKRQQINYSLELADGRRALDIRWHQSEKEQEELKQFKEDQKAKQRSMLQKKMEMREMQKMMLVSEAK